MTSRDCVERPKQNSSRLRRLVPKRLHPPLRELKKRYFQENILARKFSNFLAKVLERFYPSQSARLEQLKLFSILQRRATDDSAAYIYDNLSHAILFDLKETLWDFAISQVAPNGILAEFGVFHGGSINYFANKVAHRGLRIYGFDSFEGLKEDWVGTGLKKGHFSLGGSPPVVMPNVTLVKGWFDQTLPGFLEAHRENVSFLHFDCDTYEATRIVFSLCAERIVPGTVVLFDEYFNYPGWRYGEWKAWQEFVVARNIRYRYLGFSLTQAAMVVLA